MNKFIVLCVVLILSGCVSVVCDGGKMRIERCEVSTSDNYEYTYHITDNHVNGWKLHTNDKFELGTEVMIIPKLDYIIIPLPEEYSNEDSLEHELPEGVFPWNNLPEIKYGK